MPGSVQQVDRQVAFVAESANPFEMVAHQRMAQHFQHRVEATSHAFNDCPGPAVIRPAPSSFLPLVSQPIRRFVDGRPCVQ